MSRSPHLYFDLLDLAAAIRSDGTSARFVSVTADGGRMHCAVTSGSDQAPDAPTDPYLASHPLFGAALQEAVAGFARELVSRRFGALQELGGKGLVTIEGSGAVRLDLETRTGLTVREPVNLNRLRQAAISHPTHRAVTAFRPSGLSSDRVVELIRDRLFPDLVSPVLAPGPVPDIPEGLGTAPAWLPLDPLEAERLHAALESATDPVLSGVLAKLRTCLSDVSADEAFRAAAVDKYAGRLDEGDLDFQPDGMVSKSDEGAYVQAFLWVANAEVRPEEPEEDLAP